MADTSIICPHCRRTTSAKAQRCQACGLTMLSNAEFALLQREYWPSIEKIDSLDPKTDTSSAISIYHQIVAAADRVPFIVPHFEEVRKKWSPAIQVYLKKQQVLRFHWLILAFFGLVALVGGLFTRDWAVGGLLALPIVGWYFLGIYPLRNGR